MKLAFSNGISHFNSFLQYEFDEATKNIFLTGMYLSPFTESSYYESVLIFNTPIYIYNIGGRILWGKNRNILPISPVPLVDYKCWLTREKLFWLDHIGAEEGLETLNQYDSEAATFFLFHLDLIK